MNYGGLLLAVPLNSGAQSRFAEAVGGLAWIRTQSGIRAGAVAILTEISCSFVQVPREAVMKFSGIVEEMCRLRQN
jgi:uncharacterized membrane protein YidH (DUF202 family)